MKRFLSARPRTFAIAVVLALAAAGCGGYASAQSTIQPPAPRFVSPGEYVTLVFTLHPSVSGTAGVTFGAPGGWQLLGKQATVDVTAGDAIPLAVTAAVPPGGLANAATAIEVSVQLGGKTVTASVELHIVPQPSIALDVPAQVPIDAGEVTCTIRNTGNVPLDLSVTFAQGSTTLASRKVSIAAQASSTLSFKVSKGGRYDVTVSGTGNVSESRSVVVLAYGVPVPPPFQISVRVTSYLSSDGTWSLDGDGVGPLSDYARFSTHLSPKAPRTSYAQVDGATWGFRVGSTTGAPYSLNLPSVLGVAGEYGADAWSAFAGVGSVTTDQWAGYGGVAWIDSTDHLYVAGAVGMSRGKPTGGVALQQSLKDLKVTARMLWSDQALSVSTQADIYRQHRTLHLRADVGPDSTGAPSASLYVGYAASDLTLTAAGSVDPVSSHVSSALVGLSVPLPASALGQAQLNVQAGLDTSYVTISDVATIDRWRATGDLGLHWDQTGQGASIGTSWQSGTTDYVGLDARVRYGFDGTGVQALVGARGQAGVGPFLIFGGARADGIGRSASLRAGAQWQSGPFNADLTADLSAPYVDPWANLAASVRLRASYAFPLDVPDAVSELAGGRRVGTVRGRVDGAAGVPHLVVLVGPYRLRLAPDGSFRADLTPGTYRVRLDPTSVPVTYRIEQPSEVTVTVRPKATETVSLAIVRSAGIRGTVLFDANGDGAADKPARGVPATVALVDANGAYHTTGVGSDGTFAFRSLPPGKAVLTLSGLPLGDQPEGEPECTVSVAPGSMSVVAFLVHPVSLNAKVFGGGQLAIRSVAVEAQRVPPGAGPLVTVALSGPADAVTLSTSTGTVSLARSGSRWVGRMPVPKDAVTGLFTFSVQARRGQQQVQRRGQVLVDANVALVKAMVRGSGTPGGKLAVEVTVLAHATAVTVDGPVGSELHVSLERVAPGRWSGTMPMPDTLTPGRYELTATARTGNEVVGTAGVTAVVLERPAAGGPR